MRNDGGWRRSSPPPSSRRRPASMTASATAEVFFAKDVLHAGDTGYGVLMTLWTLGMVIGSTLVASRVPAAAYATAALAAMALQARDSRCPRCGSCSRSPSAPIPPAASGTARRTSWSARSSTRACPTSCAGGRGRPTAPGATPPSWSRWLAAACWSAPSARAQYYAAGALPVLAAAVALARAQAARRRTWPTASLTSEASPSTTTRSRPARLASYRAASAARKSSS